MEDEALQAKRAKAEKYATEPERFKLISLSIEMQSEHDVRAISLYAGVWRCTCDFYNERLTCSHIMAVKQMMKIDD